MIERFRDRWLLAAIGLQGLAAVFFVLDAVGDVHEFGLGAHVIVEGVIATTLLAGAAMATLKFRDMAIDARRSRATVKAASGAMAELMAMRFAEWHLTSAEADVALLAMKGLSGEEIAQVRGAAPGTVRAQLTRIYAKAGVNSRAGLIGLFIEDLLGEPLPIPGLHPPLGGPIDLHQGQSCLDDQPRPVSPGV